MVTGYHWWDYGQFLWLSLFTKINLCCIHNKNIQMHGTTVIILDRDISCFKKIHKSCFPWRHTIVHESQDKPSTAYYYWHSLATVFLIAAAAVSLQSCLTLCGRQPTSLLRPWDSPGKNTWVGCRVLLQGMKVKRESEVAQSCPTLSDPMDCSLPGSSIHGIFQARVLQWVAIAFSNIWFIMLY